MDEVEHWIVDGNGDGYPDDVSVRFVVDAGYSPDRDFWAALLDLSARVGLETHALPLPLVVLDTSAVPDAVEPVVFRRREDIPAIATDTFTSQTPPRVVATAPSSCLTRLFTLDGALTDHDGDLLPDASRITFDLPESLPAPLGVALANLAARIGLESGGITFPLVREGGAPFVVRVGEGSAKLRAVEGGWHAEGAADDLARLVERVAAIWPHIGAPQTAGAASALATLRRWLAGDGPEPNEPGEVVYERDWTDVWEADALVEHVSDILADLTPEGGADPGGAAGVYDRVIVFACEPPEQRQQIAARLRELVAASALSGPRDYRPLLVQVRSVVVAAGGDPRSRGSASLTDTRRCGSTR